MAVLTTSSTPLVAGARPATRMATIVRIKVLRAFLISGKPVKVGDEIEVDVVLAAELVSQNKAARVASPEPAKTAPAKNAAAKAAAKE